MSGNPENETHDPVLDSSPEADPKPLYEDDDAALARLLGDEPEDEPAEYVESLARAAVPDSGTEDIPETGTEPAPELESKPGEPPPVDPERLEKAMAALKLDRVPEDVIQTLTPQQVLSLGETLKERQREINERLAKQKGPEAETDDTAEATSQTEPAEPTVDEDLKKLIEDFSDSYGNEGGEVLSKFAQALERRFQASLSSQQAQLQQAQAYAQQVMADRVRDQLRAEIPELGNDDSYSKVVEQMAMLAQTGRYVDASPTVEGRLRKLMQDASLLTFGNKKSSPSAPAPKPTPTPVQRNQGAGRTTDSDEDDIALDLLDRGFTTDEVRRKMRGVIT